MIFSRRVFLFFNFFFFIHYFLKPSIIYYCCIRGEGIVSYWSKWPSCFSIIIYILFFPRIISKCIVYVLLRSFCSPPPFFPLVGNRFSFFLMIRQSLCAGERSNIPVVDLIVVLFSNISPLNLSVICPFRLVFTVFFYNTKISIFLNSFLNVNHLQQKDYIVSSWSNWSSLFF